MSTYVIHTQNTYTEKRKGNVLKLKVIRNLWECLKMSMTTEDRVLGGPTELMERQEPGQHS